MVHNTVHATYTETYDLNTALNEISLLGIHTSQASALKSMFKGFFENYKKYKIVAANLTMVCASQQSLTPSEIGLEAGQVDPRDILNPVLFKACTGEHLNEILNQIYGNNNLTGDTSSLSQVVDTSVAASNMYYQLLSDDTWRKEHPQRGLVVRGLIPLVHKVVTTQPFRWTGAAKTNDNYSNPNIVPTSVNATATTGSTIAGFGSPGGKLPDAGGGYNYSNGSVFISDGTVDMPWLDTTYDGTVTPTGGSSPVRYNHMIVDVPRVWCGAIILPPAILQRLFFRMQISWHIMFKDFRPAFEVGPIQGSMSAADIGAQDYADMPLLGIGQVNNPTYWNIYHDATTKLDKAFSSFDVNGSAEVTQVMESGN